MHFPGTEYISHAMATRTPNEIGAHAEERFKSVLSGKRVPGSGNGKWFKCDVTDAGRFVWSVKATEKDYIRLTKDMILEVRRAARGTQGAGDNFRAGMGLEIDGIAGVFIELDDFAELIKQSSSERSYIPTTKAQERRRSKRNL